MAMRQRAFMSRSWSSEIDKQNQEQHDGLRRGVAHVDSYENAVW